MGKKTEMKNKFKQLFVLLASFSLIAAACVSGEEDPAAAPETTAQALEDVTTEPAMEDVDLTPGDGVSVTSARATWTTGYLQAAIYAAMLTELGYEVSDPAENEFPPANGYVAMAAGEIDFWANSWIPGHLNWFDAELTDGTRVGDHLTVTGEMMPASLLEGFVITKSVAEENNIVSLEQINNDPALVELFDTDGNGKANINSCPEDWECDDIVQAIIDRNGWTNLAQTNAGYDAMLADTLARVDDGLPAIQYTWSPSGYIALLIPGDNVLWLSLGAEEFVCDATDPCQDGWNFVAAGPAALGAACTDDPCWTGWESSDIQVTANNDFLAANPSAATLFELVKISVIDAVNYSVRYDNGETTEDEIKAMAAEWIEFNRDSVDEWLDAARHSG